MDAKPSVDTRRAAWVRWAIGAVGMITLLSIVPIGSPGLAAEAPKAPETSPAPPPAENTKEETGKVQHLAPTEAASILGRPVRGPDGHDIGRIVDALVDQAGHPRAAVIDFGGFMGVGTRKIAVDWHLLHFTPGDLDKPITLELTPDQIKAAPEYKNGGTPTVVTAPAVKPGPAEGATAAQTTPRVAPAAENPGAAPNQPSSGPSGATAPEPPAGKH